MPPDMTFLIDPQVDFDFWKESIRIRIKTANDTSTRSRYTVIFLSLVSGGFIMSVFSYFYSWNKYFAFQYLANKNDINQIRDGIIREWLSTQTYQLPILGIKVMASDIPIFAPLILIIVSTWTYYEVRREHYSFGRLMGDVYVTLVGKAPSIYGRAIFIAQEVYHNLIGYTVFNVIPYDHPISHLGESLVSRAYITKRSWQMRLRRTVIKFLAFSPVLSIIFVSITRILTFITIRSPVSGRIHKYQNSGDFRFFLLWLSIILALLSLYVCIINMLKIFQLDNATRRLLDEFQLWAFEGVTPACSDINKGKTDNAGITDIEDTYT